MRKILEKQKKLFYYEKRAQDDAIGPPTWLREPLAALHSSQSLDLAQKI